MGYSELSLLRSVNISMSEMGFVCAFKIMSVSSKFSQTKMEHSESVATPVNPSPLEVVGDNLIFIKRTEGSRARVCTGEIGWRETPLGARGAP